MTRQETTKTPIAVAAYGWQGAAWAGFYPDDIPDDWRLDFYANEFFAVVVPFEAWQRADDETLLVWQEQVSDDFRFYWELPQGEASGAARLQRLREDDGFIAHWGGTLEEVSQLHISEPMELRPMRKSIEDARQAAKCTLLVIIAPAAAASLRPARDIAQLLGGG